jgi:glycogen debranching enzyme
VLRFLPTIVALSYSASWALPSAAAATPAPEQRAARLEFGVDEGLNINRFLREGKVAAHLLLRSGSDPRILVAFPAGNSGVGLWFAHLSPAATWSLRQAPAVAHQSDGRGRPLYGISAELAIAAPELEIRQAVLSSVRMLRDYQGMGRVPREIIAAPSVHGRSIRWARERLDGAPGYRLTLEVTDGEVDALHIRAGRDGRIGLRISALTGEAPLEPLDGRDLLNDSAASDRAARDTLTFLAYHEKLLAGSWRFDTYFGRDTLISVRLLMPVLSAEAIEDALASVLGRLSSQGEVAHEEDIGEQAVLDHLRSDGSRSAAPVYDYKMIDGNYLLGPIVTAWLLHDRRARSRAADFLAAASVPARHGTRGAALADNLRYVLRSASGFATQPDAAHLVSLKSGISVGNWRDSEDGLGGGRYPYDVNAVLVPAALEAAAQLYTSGLLSGYLKPEDAAQFARAAQMAQVWRSKAASLFDVTLSSRAAADAVEKYAAAAGVAARPAVDALGALGAGELRFHAIALDAAGAPIPVMHSDEGFALLFADPAPQLLDRAVTALMRPFPAGLMTDVGMLVANPAYCPPALQARFTRNAYHGTVVWSWQQALFAAGLARQLARPDLPPATRAHLLEAQRVLWAAIEATRVINNSELWSWAFANGRYKVTAFGAAAADVDESNAAQLWSTVYLAERPPR